MGVIKYWAQMLCVLDSIKHNAQVLWETVCVTVQMCLCNTVIYLYVLFVFLLCEINN